MSIWGAWLNVHAWYMRKGLKRQSGSAADTSEQPERASFATEARDPVDERVPVDLSS